MRISSGSSITGNPVLIGAATTLVILVAVFLSYNANAGLPFVPTYHLSVDAPSAANLVRGNEVRIGGARAGLLERIEARRRRDGTNYARLTLKLDQAVQPLPDDTRVIIRPVSALNLKFIELTPGTSRTSFADGDTIPLAASLPAPVELDEFLNTFDDATREASRRNLEGFGTALAGRGPALNQAIGSFRPLLTNIVPVAQNLSAPETNLRGFVRSLGRAAAEIAPVAQTQADLFTNLDTTFTALRAVARPFIGDALRTGPPALEAATRSFPRQRPFLGNSQGLFAELRPGARALRDAAPDLSRALTVGTPALERSVDLNGRLEGVFTSLSAFGKDPQATSGVRRLTQTVATLRPTLDYVTPAQTRCNYATLLLRNASSLLSEGDANGTWQRFIIVAAPQGPNNEGGPSSAPANGTTPDNHLHSNSYPNTAAPGQPAECEAGNEVYKAGATTIGNVPGTQLGSTEQTQRTTGSR